MKDCSTYKPVRSLQGFDKIVLESIDEGLTTLGENSKTVLYNLLDNSFNMKKSEILFRTNDFYDILERIFGSGAEQLQTLFLRKLDEKLGNSCVVVQLPDFFGAMANHNKVRKNRSTS